MNRLLASATITALAVAAAVPAGAAPYMTAMVGRSAVFGNDLVSCAGAMPCSFTDTLTFITPVGFDLSSATINSAMVGTDAATDINFTSVTLNGVNFNIGLTGYTEFRHLLNQTLVAGALNTLSVSGTTGGRASYGGTLVFATGAVPESSTWALMIAGFGIVGSTMRQRQKVSVSYAV